MIFPKMLIFSLRVKRWRGVKRQLLPLQKVRCAWREGALKSSLANAEFFPFGPVGNDEGAWMAEARAEDCGGDHPQAAK
jgi:hypothetical protein